MVPLPSVLVEKRACKVLVSALTAMIVKTVQSAESRLFVFGERVVHVLVELFADMTAVAESSLYPLT